MYFLTYIATINFTTFFKKKIKKFFYFKIINKVINK